MNPVCVCGHAVIQHSAHPPRRACLACSTCGGGESAESHVMVKCPCSELRFADDRCVCGHRRDEHCLEVGLCKHGYPDGDGCGIECLTFVRDGSFNGTGLRVMR